MNKINENEISYFHKMISSNYRLDKRKKEDSRLSSFDLNINANADASCHITKGNTIIEINIKFQELSEDAAQEIVNFNGDFSIAYNDLISNFISKYNLRVNIEINILKDDGNVSEAFYEGLKVLFYKIIIPDIDDLSTQFDDSLVLPSCNVFAVFDDLYVRDPCKYEELACDALVYLFVLDGKLTYLHSENVKKLDPFVLNDIILNI